MPAAVLLRPGDVGPTARVTTSTQGLATLPWTEPNACTDRTAFPSDRHRLAARTAGLAAPEPESGGVTEAVVRYAPGWGPTFLAEARRVLAACHGYTAGPPGGRVDRRYVLERAAVAGDDGLLVRVEDRQGGSTRAWTRFVTVVRVGDAVLTTSSEGGEGTADRDVALRLARVGADRAGCLRATC